MKITWTAERIDRLNADLVAVPYQRGGENPAFAALDRKARGALTALAAREGFKGEPDRSLLGRIRLKGRDTGIIAVGLGQGARDPATFRAGLARAVRHASAHRLGTVALVVDAPTAAGQLAEIGWATEAAVLSAYRFHKYKTKEQRQAPPKEILIAAFSPTFEEQEAKQAVKAARAAAGGVTLARDLVNEPANVLSPEELAARAEALAGQHGLDCTVLQEKELRELGMNLLLAVAAGAARPPRLIHLVYRPETEKKATVVFVGKGITFDSGGLCIKPGKAMADMKTDMAGAAAVLGIMSALKTSRPPVEVHAIIPATDNAVDANATRPGDIFTSMAKLTVEVVNTDAEGRLVLADALTYARRLKPDLVVDYATLTGSCIVALGPYTAGLFSPSDDAASAYLDAARRSGEDMWRLPLVEALDSSLKSDIADVKNIGGRFGGAITGALFLKRFADKAKWIHVDIAGPARAETSTPLCPVGGTGFGVLAALEYLLSL